MVNSNKILTVSYGTFSCTLEGFDDSFGTMKAIAEYFRDLAADDRYFGAEPPSPDAEMLARIAEREIARRVEAHREDNKFVLRAETPEQEALPAQIEAPQAEATKAEAENAQTKTEVEDAKTEEADLSEVASTSAVIKAGAAVTARAAALATAASTALKEDDAEDTTAELIAPPEADAPSPQDTDSGSVAEKLRRIRKVVAQNEDGSYSEDEHAQDFLEGAPQTAESAELSDAQSDIAAAFAADDEADTAAQEKADAEEAERLIREEAERVAKAQAEKAERLAEEKAEAERIAAEEARLAEEKAEAERIAAEEARLAEEKAEAERIAAEKAEAERLAAEKAAETATAEQAEEDAKVHASDDADEEDEDDISALLTRLSNKDAITEEDAEQVSAPDTAEDPAPVRAQVITMKKADFKAALEDGFLFEDDKDEAKYAIGDLSDSSLSAEEEADLMRELASVEADIERETADDTLAADLDDDVTGEDTAGNLFSNETQDRPAHLGLAESADDEANRMFAAADEKLEEEEGRGRRNAIAHLRAAVEATKAERNIGGDLGTSGRETEAYRDDLDTVVRPSHPKGQTPRDMRPSEHKPAPPLKLVAEQRVDMPNDDAPVQPRRIRVASSHAEAKPAPDDSFAEFAERVGAQNLAEVLEAAASYTSFVEGQSAFSRPQIMSKLNETEHSNSSREDRLRIFGQLLRSGKIRKVGAGRFEAAEEISYRPAS